MKQKPPFKNEYYNVVFEDLTHEGAGVAKVDGFPIFVPNALPDEKAQIKVTRVKRLRLRPPHRLERRKPLSHGRAVPDLQAVRRLPAAAHQLRRPASLQAEASQRRARANRQARFKPDHRPPDPRHGRPVELPKQSAGSCRRKRRRPDRRLLPAAQP